MTRNLIFILSLIANVGLAQTTIPTKSQVLRAFKKSIDQPEKGKIITNSNPWVVCNKDSSFYKSDTLRLYNNSNYYYSSHCCQYIDLTFYKKNAFILTRAEMCEGARISVTKDKDWFAVNLYKDNKKLILETINQGKIVERFSVISMYKVTNIGQPHEVTDVMTFVRQPKP